MDSGSAFCNAISLLFYFVIATVGHFLKKEIFLSNLFHLSDQQLDKNQPLFLLSDNAVLSNVFQVPFIKRNWNFFSDKKKEERFW